MRVMLSPHDAALHQETGDSVGLGGSFNITYAGSAKFIATQFHFKIEYI